MVNTKTPEDAASGVFYPFLRGGLILRPVAVVLSVQPFADAICDHTSHNRKNKTDK